MPTEHLDSEVRRHQIVQTTRKIVATEGMASLTIQELAKEVGVSEGAIYRHFRSKDEILAVLIQEIEHGLLDAIADSAVPHALDQLKHLLQRHFSSTERRNGVSFVVISEAMRFGDPEVRHAARQMVEHYLHMISLILNAGAEKGEISRSIDTKAAALMFFGMIQASVTLWLFNSRAHPLAQHRTALWNMFRDGLTTPQDGGQDGPVKTRAASK